ncbi:MAG: TonB-dependent receptor [Spongiibacteraceae bacterium]
MKPKLGQSLAALMLFKPLVPVTCSAFFLLPSFAFAETKSNAPVVAAGQFEEVVVTARRKEEELQEVPISVSAFSADYLRENNITEMSSLAAHVPSMSIETAGSSTNSPIIALRGQRPAESLITIDPAVPLYFADVALTPTQGTNISLYDLSNVQVLKGPQGTLFGKSSTGGAVLFTPAAPGSKLGGYIQGVVGDYNLRGVEGAVDLPVNDMLYTRFSGFKQDRDGYQENIANNALHGKKYWDDHPEALRASFKFEPTDSLSNLLVMDWSSNSIRARVPTTTAFVGVGDCSFCKTINSLYNTSFNNGTDVYPWKNQLNDAIARQSNRSWQKVETDNDAKEKITNQIISNTTTFDIQEDMSIKNILAYRRLDYKYGFDTDGTALAITGTRTNGRVVGDVFAVTYSGQYPDAKVESEQYSDELQFSFKAFHDRLDMVVGAYYFLMDGTELKPVQLAAQVDQWRDSPSGDAENVSRAIFSEGTFEIIPELSLTLGVRYTEDERSMVAKNVDYTGDGTQVCLVAIPNSGGATYPIDQCARKESETFEALTYRGVVTYKPTTSQMYYGSISTGYRPGGFNLRAAEDFQFEPYSQEEVLNYEVGAKTDWLSDSGIATRINAALFWQDYTDIQKTQGDARSSTGFGTNTVNAAGAVVRGADLELSVIPIDGLTMSLNYSYIDAYYKKWKALNPITSIEQDQSGYDFLNIPRHSGNASVSYLLPFDPNIGDITLHASYTYQSEVTRFEDIDGTFNFPGIDNGPLNDARKSPSYYLIDLRADWANMLQSGIDAAMWVKNLEDKKYSTGGLQIPESLGFFSETYGPPRTVGASLRYKF